jgi:hypothetical protein
MPKYNQWDTLCRLCSHVVFCQIVLIYYCDVLAFYTVVCIYILMWSCPANMPKYYPGLRDIFPRLICISDLGNILAYYLDKTTLISLLYWESNFPGNMPKYYPGNAKENTD